MTSNEALKPCPFCGESLTVRATFYDRDFREQEPVNIAWHSGFVASDSPCMFSGKGFYESEWDKWNTRSTDTPVCASTGKLRPRVIRALRDELSRQEIKLREGSIDLATLADAALAASQAPETIERLREALNDAIATILAVRATAACGGEDWNSAAAHFHQICGETLCRVRPALSSIPEPLIMPLEGSK